ncbi:hypothetical protein DSECCO2_592220 [anaerobic digester metagenome]
MRPSQLLGGEVDQVDQDREGAVEPGKGPSVVTAPHHLFPVDAGHLLHAPVPGDHVPLTVHDEGRVRHELDRLLQLLVAPFQRLLGLTPFGHVHDREEDAEKSPRTVQDGRCRDLGGERTPVSAQAPDLPGPSPISLEGVPDLLEDHGGRQIPVREQGVFPTHDLRRCAVPEDGDEGPVCVLYPFICPDDRHPVDRGGDRRLFDQEVALPLVGLGHVPHDRLELNDHTIGVTERAVRPLHPPFLVPGIPDLEHDLGGRGVVR